MPNDLQLREINIPEIKTIEEREYQIKLIRDCGMLLRTCSKIIVCAATGSGKTVVFVKMANGAIKKNQDRAVLIITEATKIFEQIISDVTAIEINPDAKDVYVVRNRIYVAMAQTLARRASLIESFAKLGTDLLIINDECHVGTSSKLLLQMPSALLIGFSATPDYRFAKHLPTLYKGFVMGPQPDELVQGGFLSSYRHFQRKAADLSHLKTKGGEFTEESQEIAFETKKVYDGLFEDLTTVPYRKCMIFVSSIKHCEKLYAELITHDFHCVRLHSKRPDANAVYDMAAFKTGSINICVSVGSLTKGFDYKPTDLIVLQRATNSLPLYLQMIGRASRPFPNKQYFTVLDYGLNLNRLGFWDEDRPWDEMWLPPKKKKKPGVPPIKICPGCEMCLRPSVMICPNCGHVFVKMQEKEIETVLIEETSEYRKLIGKRLSELTADELATYAKLKNKKNWCMRIAMAMEQESPGFLRLYGIAMGYKFGWVSATMSRINPNEKIQFQDHILR